MSVKVTMKTGTVHTLSGYASRVQEQINAGRGKGQLIAVERDVIPTGQMAYIDPDEVESVRDDGYR